MFNISKNRLGFEIQVTGTQRLTAVLYHKKKNETLGFT